jgi:hypothetical protein
VICSPLDAANFKVEEIPSKRYLILVNHNANCSHNFEHISMDIVALEAFPPPIGSVLVRLPLPVVMEWDKPI